MPSWVYLHNTSWWNHALIYIFFYRLFLNLSKSICVFWVETMNCPVNSDSGSPVWMLSWLQAVLAVSYGFTARDRTVFHAICCVWPLRWWSAGRVTPGRICSKSSLLVMGGPEPGSMLGDWSAPYSKAKYRKPSQRRRPCRTWSHPLLWSPLQYLSCFTAWINMSNFYLVKLLSLPSSVRFTPGWAKSCAAAVRKDFVTSARIFPSFFFFFCRLFNLPPFSLFFLV